MLLHIYLFNRKIRRCGMIPNEMGVLQLRQLKTATVDVAVVFKIFTVRYVFNTYKYSDRLLVERQIR